MKNYAKKAKRAAALCAAVACIAFAVITFDWSRPAYANSAARWYSVAGLGVYPPDDCPLEVETEVLSFKIDRLPAYGDMDGYSSSVTADYTFKNPSEADLSVRMLFPFGGVPYYADGQTYTDGNLISVTADGEPCAFDVRCSYNPYVYDSFDFDMQSSYLSDEARQHAILSPEASAAAFAVNQKEGETVFAEYTDEATFVAFCDGSFSSYSYGRTVTVELYGECTLYFVGGLPSDLSFKDSEGGQFDAEQSGAVFSEIIDSFRPSYLSAGAKEGTDWFNFVVDVVLDDFYGNVVSLNQLNGYYAQDRLMRWVEYEISVPAGGTADNAVTVPVYPEISGKNYDYMYYLSPAGEWADFGTLTISVETPFYIVSSSPVKFVEEDGVYSAQTGGLPDGELSFTLSASSSSSGAGDTADRIAVGIVGALLAFTVVIVAGAFIAMAIILSKKDKNVPPSDATGGPSVKS